jgi:hypothetical protein
MGLASLSRGIHHRETLAERDTGQVGELTSPLGQAIQVVGLKLGRIRPVSHGTDRYGYIRLALIFVRLHVLIVFSKSSKTRSHEADSKSQSVSGFGITKFALGNSLLIDGKRLGSANESPLSRLSWAMGKRG